MDQARNPDPSRHLAFLYWWCNESKKRGRFQQWDRDELLAEAYLQAHRLLSTLYDPDKSTVVTFLKAFLWGAVHYAYWAQQGYRFDDVGKKEGGRSRKVLVRKLEFTDCETNEPLAKAQELYTSELSSLELTGEEWTIVRLRMDGYTMTQIAAVLGLKSPQSIQNRLSKIWDKIEGAEDNAPRNRTDEAAEGPREKRKNIP